jgi:hypothetical protein
MEDITSFNILEKYPNIIKDEHRVSFEVLFYEVFALKVRLENYRMLYEDDSNVALLHHVARPFFRLHQIDCLAHLVMGIARLMDPPSTTGNDNLTLKRLKDYVSDAARAQNIGKLIDDLAGDMGYNCIRKYRHTEVGHFDYGIMTGSDDSHGYQVNLNTISKVIDDLTYIISVALGEDTTIQYKCCPTVTAQPFLDTLRAGLKYQNLPENEEV